MTSQQDAGDEKYFDADQPIERREQDRLGRRTFAEAIAQQIQTIPAEHGFTVAVLGEWGSGKTSVLNMVEETLTSEAGTTTVLRFNPWLFGGAADLVTRFFAELSAQLDQGQSEGLKNVALALSGIGRALAPLAPVPGVTAAVGVASAASDYWAKPPSLLRKRTQLMDALKKSDSRILVLIDDIDRLEPAETRELVRLVRLTSDLPNLVFLLAFDGRRVAKSLGANENEEEGQRYLDKIVQVSHTLPVVREAILLRMLRDSLEELIPVRNVGQLQEEDRWGRVLYDVVKPLLGNLRDVKRYLYSLPVALDTLAQEVALADLLGLEALRILRPPMFEDLKAHTDCLVHSESGLPPKDHKQELQAMLGRAEDKRAVLESVFELLFPATQGFLGDGGYGTERTGTWRGQRRVACDYVLRIYLQAGLDEAALPASEVADLVEALTDEDKLKQMLDSLDDERFGHALERLEDFEHEFPLEAVPIAVPVLVNRIGCLSRHPPNFLEPLPRFKASRVTGRLLRRRDDSAAPAESVFKLLEKIEAMSGQLAVVETVGYRETVGHRLLDEDQAEKLEDRLVERLASATAEQLTDEWDLAGLSMRTLSWLEGEGKERLAARLRQHLSEDGFVLASLRTAVGYMFSNGHSEKRLPWDALVEAFGDGLATATDRLASSQLCREASDDDKETVSLAQEYASGRRPKEGPWS